MRNMIFKTLIASILGSFLVAQPAHADRQGGGTLMQVSFAVNDGFTHDARKYSEFVRFHYVDGDRVAFDFFSTDSENFEPTKVTIQRAELSSRNSALVRALLVSKKLSTWQAIDHSTAP